MIKDLAFDAYSVRDVPAAVAFYRDTIGLTPGALTGDRWTEFAVGTTTFGIGDGESIGAPPGSSFGAAFEVDDVAQERERLLALGVPVTEVFESPFCYSAFVTDPEGNRFAVHRRKEKLP
jgi:predicted enzyme related to lactoylglutathione lyase